MVDKRKLFMNFTGLMTVIFIVLTFWSMASGKTILNTKVAESEFEKDAFEQPHATFEVDSGGVAELEIQGVTLNNSWVWVKAIIIDDQNNAVLENTFNLSYYSGSGWSEGDRDESWAFYLPKGKYKLLIYGEDAKRRSGWTRPRAETIGVTITAGAVLTRYFLIGLVLFGFLFFISLGNQSSSDETDFESFDSY